MDGWAHVPARCAPCAASAAEGQRLARALRLQRSAPAAVSRIAAGSKALQTCFVHSQPATLTAVVADVRASVQTTAETLPEASARCRRTSTNVLIHLYWYSPAGQGVAAGYCTHWDAAASLGGPARARAALRAAR